MMKCRCCANSNLRNGASVATKGKLAATQTTTKFVATINSHRFRQSIAKDLKLATRFHNFAKTTVTSQKLAVYSNMFQQVKLKNYTNMSFLWCKGIH